MDDYQRRKQERRERYLAKHGVKMVVCVAYSGTGIYDSHGSPACGACEGRGKHFPALVLPAQPSAPGRRVSQRKRKK